MRNFPLYVALASYVLIIVYVNTIDLRKALSERWNNRAR